MSGLTVDEVNQVRVMLTVVKWLVGLFSVSLAALITCTVIAITDHVRVSDMAQNSVEVRQSVHRMEIQSMENNQQISTFKNTINNLERRIAYTNKVDHPKVLPNGEEGFQ